MTAGSAVDDFLATKFIALNARARRLTSLTPRQVGLRPQDVPYAPSAEHFAVANRRLQAIDRAILARISALSQRWPPATPGQGLARMALLEREVDRARRTFGMLFEVFSSSDLQGKTPFQHEALAVVSDPRGPMVLLEARIRSADDRFPTRL
jgi:hypothetical protein